MKAPGVTAGLLVWVAFSSSAQSTTRWDDEVNKDWPEECELVSIPSTLDEESQQAYFYSSQAQNRPLIVSLHTWSGNYAQRDTLSWMAIDLDFNYIHPDFRGRNNNPKACGSEYVVHDIEDAISFALEAGNVDPNEIHVTGVSGGGFATMLTYMKTNHQVRTFSAWVGISDLVKWYHESEGRSNRYSLEIAQSTSAGATMTKDKYTLNEREARRRSPMFLATPVGRRADSKLFIYAGVHDGYTGSVPITQSIDFYNKVVTDFGAELADRVSDSDVITLLTRRSFPSDGFPGLGQRQVHYRRTYDDNVQLVLFEGGHERVQEAATLPMLGRRVLVLGDSNGAAEDGWVTQLQRLQFRDFFYNTSVSGNTIGFDNLDNPQLNTLRNIQDYLSGGATKLNGITDIIISLGTNDCKAVFDDRLSEVPSNLDALISKIKDHEDYQRTQPNIYVVGPPPYGRDDVMLPKYHGGARRVAWLQKEFEDVAQRHGCQFIDIHSRLEPNWDYYAPEGIHPKPEAQKIIASMIDRALDKQP